jgi:hypothetical protein
VPPLKDYHSEEQGHPNYQHPKRGNFWGPQIDNFSEWVIFLSLLAFMIKPDLINELDGDRLLFCRDDFIAPDSQNSFFQTWKKKFRNDLFEKYISRFRKFLDYNDVSQIPSIKDEIKDDIDTIQRPVDIESLDDTVPETDVEIFPTEPIVTVSQHGNGQYNTIREAIENVQENTTIEIYAGRYIEDITINKPLKLIGKEDRIEEVIIEGFIQIQGPATVEISNLTLEDGGRHNAVINASGRLELRGCKITGSKDKTGIYMGGGGTLEYCDIWGNASGTGIQILSNDITIYGCIIKGWKKGISTGEVERIRIENCNINENIVAICVNNTNLTVQHCNIYDNIIGVLSTGNFKEFYIKKCKIYSMKKCGIFIYKCGKCRNENVEHDVFVDISDCNIENNGCSGIKSVRSLFRIWGVNIKQNGLYGVELHKYSEVDITNCDLSNNLLGELWREDDGV